MVETEISNLVVWVRVPSPALVIRPKMCLGRPGCDPPEHRIVTAGLIPIGSECQGLISPG